MNITRIAILGVAAIAAGGAALMVRGMLGGGTPASQASVSQVSATTDVLVASKDVTPGHVLDAASVRWEGWPKSSVSKDFITKETQPDIAKAITGVVVRAPLVPGQPITDANVVHAGAAGFLSATIAPGMRAIGVSVTAQTSAGGFILPNDRVDVVLTRELPTTGGAKQYVSETFLNDVRVLAVDQTAHQDKDKDSVVGKTATLELTPDQAEQLAHAEQIGVLSLTLRALGDNSGEADSATRRPARTATRDQNTIVVFRYGVMRNAPSAGGGSGSTSVASASSEPAAITNPNPITFSQAPAATPQ
jgi:pilus assembly protein CpaB